MRNLIRLTVAFIDKKTISGLKPNLPPVLLLPIGDLNFALVFRKSEKPGEYEVFDFFRSDINIAYKDSNGEMIPTSQYVIFHADDLLKIQNIRPELFLPSFQKVEADDKYTRANWFLLELLEAYDKSNDTRQDLLKAASELSTWLCDAPENYLDYHVKCLNHYQVLKRERGLNIDEIAELWKIAEDNTVDDTYKLGAYLLLDQQVPAEHHFAKLSKEMQNEFREYPIFRYFRVTEDSDNGYESKYSSSMSLEEYWIKTGKSKRFIRRNKNGTGKNEGVEHWVAPADGILRNSNWSDYLISKPAGMGIVFNSPKNPDVIIDLIKLFGVSDDDIILDFFSGSATTAHATMQLNSEDRVMRKFILVQLPEIAKQKPYYFVMRDSSMKNDSVATNVEQIFATYSPDTVRRVL